MRDSIKSMRLGALAALFAMALIYIAPLISQAEMGSNMAMSMGHMSHTGHMGNHSDTSAYKHSLSHPKTQSHGLEAACGYCTLLFHLSWLNAPTLMLPAIHQHTYLQTVDHVRQQHSAYTLPSLPRAPPLA